MSAMLDELERHRATCKACRPWSTCAEASKLLGGLTTTIAERIAPIPSKKDGKA